MSATLPLAVGSARAQARESFLTSRAGYATIVGIGLLLGLSAYSSGEPGPVLALAILSGALLAIAVRPIAGVYVIAFFTVFGDALTMDWYPFTLNFSSAQSLLYLSPSLTFSPLELCIGATLASAFVRAAAARRFRLQGRPVLGPLLVFAGFVVVGILYGVGVKGGDRVVAVWEFRPLLDLVAVFVLASSLLTRTIHYIRLAQVIVAAVVIQSIFALVAYTSMTGAEREDLETLTDHPASLIYGWLVLLVLVLWTLRRSSWPFRLLATLAALPVALVMVLSQRRAAIIGMGAAFVVFAVVLFFRRRKAFVVLVPLVALFTVGYTAAFWNTTSGIGFGAQAIKSVIAPDSLTEKDASSDLYRQIENFDLAYTVRSEPVLGVGFGKQFYRPVPLPNISFFIFYQYIPHNSMLWIWLKTGFFGFVTLLFTFAATIRAGIHASLRLPLGDTLVVAVGALLFVVMFVVFAFVDIIWSAQPCVMLALSMATCANLVRLARAEGIRLEDVGQPARSVAAPPSRLVTLGSSSSVG